MKEKIYLCQFSAPFASNKKILYLPYSVGLLWSFAKLDKEVNDKYECQFLIEKQPIDQIVEQMDNPSVVGFSSYVWNHNYNLVLSKAVKQKFPSCTIVFGGPSVPYKDKKFLIQHDWIDFVIYHEGEVAFYDLLKKKLKKLSVQHVKGVGYIDKQHKLICNSPERIKDLNIIPSPYTEGLFADLIDFYKEKDIILNVILETNRGCPYSCTFCDWGNGMLGKVKNIDICRTKQEIEWFAKNKIEFITVADANFGIYKRKDLEIAKFVCRMKKTYGYPKFFHYTMSKQFFPQHLDIAKVLLKNNLMRQFTVSLQDTNHDVLDAIKRRNISQEGFEKVKKMCDQANIPLATELMIPLPQSTYHSWMQTINHFHENDVYVGWNPTGILPNTEMNDKNYRKKYGLKTKINVMPTSEYVDEHEEVLIQTNTITKKEVNDAILITWIIDVLHGHGFTDIFAQFYSKIFDKQLVDFYQFVYEYFVDKQGTLLYSWFHPLKNHVEDKKTYQLYGGATNYKIFQQIGADNRLRFFLEMKEFLMQIFDVCYIDDLLLIQYYRQTHSYTRKQKTINLQNDILEFLQNNNGVISHQCVKYRITYKPIEDHFDSFGNFIIEGRFRKSWKPLKIKKL